ncbi:hypothetical protein DFH09DRAFT_1364713 [Mycena vulgaris]|nr:hypothetical protein DFH09DRAFT_1364713 [Mycena vulgaris]
MADGAVSIGLVVGLAYQNPWLEPYREFQRIKHHPRFRVLLTAPGAECLAYGASTLTEGGLQSFPQLHFPGGALIGPASLFRRFLFIPTVCKCSAGVVNTAKIKGTHNAIRTGMLAAEAAFPALHPGVAFVSTASPATFKHPASSESSASNPASESTQAETVNLRAYSAAFPGSPAHADLWAVRNALPTFATRLGLASGVLYAGVDMMLRGRMPCTLGHHGKGRIPRRPRPTRLAAPIAYLAFEPPLRTDLMSNVALKGTNHAKGEAVHLRVMRGVDGPALGGASAKEGGSAKEGQEDGRRGARARRRRRRGGGRTSRGIWGRMRGCCSVRVRGDV